MARMVEPDGAVAACARPFRPPAYEPSRVPDPITCAGAVITINDRHDGNPRPHLAMSNGASWDRYVRADEVESLVSSLVSSLMRSYNPSTVDVTQLVQQAVRDTLPTLVQRAMAALPAPQPAAAPMALPSDDERIKVMAQAMLEMSEQIARLQHAVNDHSRVIDGALIPVPAGAAA